MAFRVFSFLPSGAPLTRCQCHFPPDGFFVTSLPTTGPRPEKAQEDELDKLKKEALQVAKEITVKFIETGRISPNNFPEFFDTIYREVLKTISTAEAPESGETGPRE
jgi:hypothetical protein